MLTLTLQTHTGQNRQARAIAPPPKADCARLGQHLTYGEVLRRRRTVRGPHLAYSSAFFLGAGLQR